MTRRQLLLACGAMAVLMSMPTLSAAAVIYTKLATPLLTPNNPAGGNTNGTGVWFNVLTGTAEIRGTTFPTPLFEDGKFFLLRNTSFVTPEAEVFTQGLFSRGNGVIYASAANLNPARFNTGSVIGAGVGFQSPGAGFTDLGPTFGNWQAGGQGFLGFTIRDPSGASSSDIFYGFAEINVNPDFSVTLLAFGYENVRGTSITTFAVPEPTTWALCLGAGAIGFFAWRRRQVLLHRASECII